MAIERVQEWTLYSMTQSSVIFYLQSFLSVMAQTVDVIKCAEEHNSTPFVSLLDGDAVIFCQFIKGRFFVVIDVTDLSRIVVD